MLKKTHKLFLLNPIKMTNYKNISIKGTIPNSQYYNF